MLATDARKITHQMREEIMKKIEVNVYQLGYDLLRRAISLRVNHPDAHNITGNLLNSIVVCIYRDNQPRIAYFTEDFNIKKAVMKKMSERKRKKYNIYPDYEGGHSTYKPEVRTNKGWGIDDARKFAHSYRPNSGSAFDIVVCYPVEYATFVDNERQSTGIAETYTDAKSFALHFLQMN